RKHLKPSAPASSKRTSSPALPGTAPPQKPTSTQHCPRAAARFTSRFSTVVVGGMLFSGMSTSVVTPPAAAARVAVANPSQSVRPGSLMWTCASTIPGETMSSPASTSGTEGGTSSKPATATMTPPATWIVAGRIAPPLTTRRPLTTRSMFTSASPSEVELGLDDDGIVLEQGPVQLLAVSVVEMRPEEVVQEVVAHPSRH